MNKLKSSLCKVCQSFLVLHLPAFDWILAFVGFCQWIFVFSSNTKKHRTEKLCIWIFVVQYIMKITIHNLSLFISKLIAPFFQIPIIFSIQVQLANLEYIKSSDKKDLKPIRLLLVQINNGNTRAMCEVTSKLTIKTSMTSFWRLYC